MNENKLKTLLHKHNANLSVVNFPTDGDKFKLTYKDGFTRNYYAYSLDSIIKRLEVLSIKNEFYLEISGRQVGKTYRLCQDVKKHIEAGGIACIYCFNTARFKDHLQHMLIKTGVSVVPNNKLLINPTESHLMGIDRDLIRNYFDEFDFLMEDNVFFDPNGYYCTSPRKLRSKESVVNRIEREYDILLKLFWHNNLEAVKHVNLNIAGNLWEFADFNNGVIIEREGYGKFLK